MKKITIFGLITVMFFGLACGGKKFPGIEYSEIGCYDWLQVNVVRRGGDKVLWLQIYDQKDEKDVIASFLESGEKVGKFPAKIYENQWVFVLVNKRFEIRLVADEKAKDFRNTARLKEFFYAFDLDGLQKIRGGRITCRELKKYLPPLPGR